MRVDALWTFGRPRIGDPAFAFLQLALQAQNTGNMVFWRVVHYHDPIPSMAPPALYKHVPRQVYYTSRDGLENIICDWDLQGYEQNATCGHKMHSTLDIADGFMKDDHVNYFGKSLELKLMNEKCVPPEPVTPDEAR